MYATKQDLIDHFGEPELIQLTDRDGSLGAIDDTVLDQARADSAAVIDASLGVRYSLPLAITPTLIVGIDCNITRYELYGNSAPEEVRNRYKDAVAMLDKIAAGKITLGLPDASAPDGQGAGDVEIDAPTSIFSRDDLQGF